MTTPVPICSGLAKALAALKRRLRRGDLGRAAGQWRQDVSRHGQQSAEVRREMLSMFADHIAEAVRGGDFAAAREALCAAADLAHEPSGAAAASDPGPPESVPERFVLWVDGIGSYLVLTRPTITVGRWQQDNAVDLALRAAVSRRHAQLQRVDGDWFLTTDKAMCVNHQHVDSALLSDGDEIEFGAGPSCRFRLPTPLSATAMLCFASSCLPSRDTRDVVLMAEHVVLSNDASGHVCSSEADARVVLFWSADGLQCQVEGNAIVNGRVQKAPCRVRLGDRIEARGWSFSLTGDDS